MSEILQSNQSVFEIQEKIDAGESLKAYLANGVTYHGPFRGELNEDGVWSAEIFDQVEGTEEYRWLGQIVSLNALIGPELGSSDSINMVQYFSAGIKRNEDSPTEFVDVAVKPFTPSSPSMGPQNEYNATLKAHKRGFNVFLPLAIIKNGDYSYLMTEYRPDVVTLDNFDLTIHPDDPRFEKEMVPILKYMTDTMAELAARGIIHGDPQPKNFAITDTGETLIPDLEFAEIAESVEDHEYMFNGAGAIKNSSVFHDFFINWRTLTQQPYAGYNNIWLAGVEDKVYMRAFANYIDMYISALETHVPDELYQKFDPEAFKEALLTDPIISIPCDY